MNKSRCRQQNCWYHYGRTYVVKKERKWDNSRMINWIELLITKGGNDELNTRYRAR